MSTGNNEIEAASAITKTGSVSWWDAGALSTQKILANSDGYAQIAATTTSDDTLFGLGTGSTDPGYANIDFGIHLGGNASTAGSMEILESGTSRGWQTAEAVA